MKRVAICTNSPLVAAGIEAMLRGSAGEMQFFSSPKTRDGILECVTEYAPNAAIFELVADDDLTLLREVRNQYPQCAIVLLAQDLSPEVAHQALELGVRAVVPNTASREMFQDCLNTVRSGERWIAPSLATSLLWHPTVVLTPRQCQLVELLVQGLKNRQIAEAMSISEATVKAYLTKLFEKVGAKDRFELALYGLRNLNYIRTMSRGGRGPSVPRSTRPPVAPTTGTGRLAS
jgi:two-component system nitrate/nitrite response regulator NarL